MYILIIGIAWGVVWGFAVKKVIENKGYTENWFWWGFFFGFIAMIVALTKPTCRRYSDEDYNSPLSAARAMHEHEKIMAAGGWSCPCGRDNASYVGICACGRTKAAILEEKQKNEEEKALSERLAKYKEYKEMLDAGIISQEEFKMKKKEYGIN